MKYGVGRSGGSIPSGMGASESLGGVLCGPGKDSTGDVDSIGNWNIPLGRLEKCAVY